MNKKRKILTVVALAVFGAIISNYRFSEKGNGSFRFRSSHWACSMPGCSFSLEGKMPSQCRVVRLLGGTSRSSA